MNAGMWNWTNGYSSHSRRHRRNSWRHCSIFAGIGLI